ncbi:MAG TPA: hypothetical protein VFG00_02165, partial [Acidothermaceae bacterium]|nr:hypothetical protein [Acidothermaceae bacterium]
MTEKAKKTGPLWGRPTENACQPDVPQSVVEPSGASIVQAVTCPLEIVRVSLPSNCLAVLTVKEICPL